MAEQRGVDFAPPEQQTRPKRRRSTGWLWLLILAGIGYGVFRYYQAGAHKAQAAQQAQAQRAANRAVSVAATAAHKGNIPVLLRGLGTVTAFNTVTVKTRVDGPLIGVYFKEGQFVNKGDLLAEIDPRTFQVQVEQAEGQLARDQAQLHDAQVNLQRDQALWSAKVIARQQLDTQAAQVGQYSGTIAADQAAIDNAKLQLSFCKITAPLSGRIGLRLVDPGNIVHAADTTGIAVIVQVQPIAVLFTIPSENLSPVLAKLRAGAKLPVEAYDRDDRNRIASGTLLTVDNQIDPTTGTSKLKAVFDNSDHALFPNQFVNCHLLLDTRRNIIIIPTAAVERGPEGTYVYVIQPDHTAVQRPITEGITNDNQVEVTSGLAAGELVVTDGQDQLENGKRVTVRPESTRKEDTGAAGSPVP
ncbi:MAG TPA: MdtA/MuxA family multidrug efflux RND transporter periplasmic adaptor subunit [Bryobacteraceae bacterium]|nr:MdtA/MuxA family multidrug efflux RND transporter periplasmic adaptor subunit [Bryobacteraceae bacterium]